MIRHAIVTLLILVNATAAAAHASDELEAMIALQGQQMQQENQRWQAQLTDEQQQVQGQTQSLLSRKEAAEAQLVRQQATLSSLQLKRQALETQLSEAQEDMALVDSGYRHAAQRLQQRWQSSPTTLLAPNRQAWMAHQAQQAHFPSQAELDTLMAYALNDLRYTAGVHQTEHPLILADGTQTDSTVRVIGGLMATAQHHAQFGLVQPKEQHAAWIGPLSSETAKPLALWWQDPNQIIPLDLSYGAILDSLTAQRGLAHWVARGGELLWPILLLALFGLSLALICAIRLCWWRPLPEALMEIAALKAAPVCRRTPAQSVLQQGLKQGADLDAMEHALKHGMLTHWQRFQWGLTLLPLLAALAPMLGLLGTVSGMIQTFQALTEFGNADPRLLSDGISKALITTQAGLIVAVPLMLLHHPLKRRARSLGLNMEQASAQLMAHSLSLNPQRSTK
ncbi:MotA/TolQ/ExbB proton channel family protein [Ferrimonas pelagia]|uniref:MotA/TolQ/ExbB proton channel family protein n=1 Tax=Ferrimonas pelagia TaxID=1177826 RepID=A0ABP9EEA6_9GAMM